jgi:predicted Zn-dependent peptidase
VSPVDRSRLPLPSVSPSIRFPPVHRHHLANGLAVRAVTHTNVPVVSAVLIVRGGTAADPANREGLAAFTADLLDEGSGGRTALQVADELARYGADLDVDVGPDATLVSLTTLTPYARPALTLLAEMALLPNLDDADIARVRKLRLERLRQLRDHAPALAERALARVLYGSHPYGHLSLGSEASLADTTSDDLRAFHAAAFAPARSTLIIVGDAPVERLVEIVDLAFGAWEARPSSLVVDTEAGLRPPPDVPEPRLAVVPRPGAAQSELRIGHLCTSRSTPDYHTLVVLNMILGGQFVSRVNMNLRQDKGYTYGVRTGFDLRRGLGPFVLQTSVQTEVTVAAIRESLAELSAIRDGRPATDAELSLAQAAVMLGFPRGLETAQQVARNLVQVALHDLPDSWFEDYVPRIEAVTANEVTRVAQRYLDPGKFATVIVGDIERLQEDLATLGDPALVAPL